jgi:hypothetical protein
MYLPGGCLKIIPIRHAHEIRIVLKIDMPKSPGLPGIGYAGINESGFVKELKERNNRIVVVDLDDFASNNETEPGADGFEMRA